MMGFPEWYEFPVSRTQTMKQLGNSVAVDAVHEVAKSVIAYLKNTDIPTTNEINKIQTNKFKFK